MIRISMMLLLAIAFCCCRFTVQPASAAKGKKRMTITVSSSAFKNGETIPTPYTCSGKDVSPPLSWSGVPEKAVSLAILVEDPDAPRGIWTHWVLFNLPPHTTGLPEGVPKTATLDNGAHQGLNDSHTVGYEGPCPPPGPAHRYYFKVFALDKKLTLNGNVGRKQLQQAMEGHILAQGEVMGRFGR